MRRRVRGGDGGEGGEGESVGRRGGGGCQWPVEKAYWIRKGLAVWRCLPQHFGSLVVGSKRGCLCRISKLSPPGLPEPTLCTVKERGRETASPAPWEGGGGVGMSIERTGGTARG